MRYAKYVVPALLVLGLAWHWKCAMFILSNMHKSAFFITRYEYGALFDQECEKELSWGKKIFCLKEYANEPMMRVLRGIEKPEERKTLQFHPARWTEKCVIGGKTFVFKWGVLNGCMHNILLMGLGVNIWNNAEWMHEKGVPVLQPIALVEMRKWNRTETILIYAYQGENCEEAVRQDESCFYKLQQFEELLCQKRVIHPDFRARNLLLLEDGSIQCIDIDTIYFFPKASYLFRERMAREVRKFNENLAGMTGTEKRLHVGFCPFWDRLMFDLSRAYKKVFLATQYDYDGIASSDYFKEVSWGKKILCTDPLLLMKLRAMEWEGGELLCKGSDRKTELKGLFVVKSAELHGFFRNLLRMGTGVNIWNNAHFMREKDIPVLKPVAVLEERKWNYTKTAVFYPYEGHISPEISPNIYVLQEQLWKNRVIHPDLALRNIVILGDGSPQLIDIDTMHTYPKGSYLFRKRTEWENRRLHGVLK